MKVNFSGFLLSLLGPLAALHAAESPKPDVKVTQELLNSIHVTPKLIFDPFPAYAEKYLPFAMAASMESTPKGRLWTCWAGGEDGPVAYLLASYSDDAGESWRDPVFVIDPRAHGLTMGTRLGSFWCDPKGRLWLFFHQSVGMFDGSCSNWFVRCDDPDAEKPVWTEPVYIGFGASLNKPIVRKNGEWILPVSLWERWHIDKPFADRYRELDAVRGANVFVSDDEGASWRFRGGIIFKDSCFNEHSVVELADGRLWMLSRGMKEAFQSFSSDGGATWEPQATFFPHVNSKAVFRRLQSGNLLLVKHGQDMATSPERKGPSDGGVRKELTAFLSRDDGKTWSEGLLLDERSSVSYPDIAQAPNGDIYIHYDRDRYGAAEILFARFRDDDVLAGRLVSGDAALKKLVKSRQHGMHRDGAEKTSAVDGVPALWDPGVPLPKSADLPQVRGVEFHVIKPRRPDVDGCRWTLGVGLCWHEGRLYASYGFNKGDENTPTEEAHARVSDDGGKTWGPAVVMDAGEGDLGVSHGVFLSQGGRLWAFMGAFHGRFERTHTRAYVLDEATGRWEPRGVVVGDGFWAMQEPQRMADGNWVMAGFRAAKGYGVAGNPPAVAISHGDDFTKWDLVVIPPAPEHRQNLWGESTVIVEGKKLTNISRYGAKPLALVSTSDDAGRTWTPATVSNLPMATSKPYAGILSTGQRYLVCTTTADSGGRRSPLTIAVSRPGDPRFSTIYRVRDSVCDATPGVSHPKADMSYPYAVEHDGKLYVGYTQKSHAANELAVIPIDALDD